VVTLVVGGLSAYRDHRTSGAPLAEQTGR